MYILLLYVAYLWKFSCYFDSEDLKANYINKLFFVPGYKFIVVTTAITNSSRLLEALLDNHV